MKSGEATSRYTGGLQFPPLAEVPPVQPTLTEVSPAGATRLTPAQAEALWRAWTTKKDSAARDRPVLAYAPTRRHLPSKKVRELPAPSELDALVSCGLLALVTAVDRFAPVKGA